MITGVINEKIIFLGHEKERTFTSPAIVSRNNIFAAVSEHTSNTRSTLSLFNIPFEE